MSLIPYFLATTISKAKMMPVTQVSVEKASIKKASPNTLFDEGASNTKFIDAAVAISSIETKTFRRLCFVNSP
jgi:hypothetical protein